ncbi:MAG: DUF1152 domain-containing protein [Thermoleophilaceae bacterium]|jgi:hypothetical protein|nr:DUF1152 domain-containing protein [Thermoleophilaceae bacterium]
MLAAARRPLAIGIGGGGDVVGALATAEACRRAHGADPVVGGVAWERLVIDPEPGPRGVSEIVGDVGRPAEAALLAGPDTRVAASGVLFGEAHMARFLGRDTVLVDVLGGPVAVADGLAATARALGADLLVFVDVGGDVLGHGDEPGLASPLCDAVMLAAAARLATEPEGPPVLAAVFAPGCDGELTLEEIAERVAEVAVAGGLAGARGLTPAVAERLEQAVREVPTEASAQALRCFRGERGVVAIRHGEREVALSPVGATTTYLDPRVTVATAARLAAAVYECGSLEEANDVLHSLGVRSELDLERERERSPSA